MKKGSRKVAGHLYKGISTRHPSPPSHTIPMNKMCKPSHEICFLHNHSSWCAISAWLDLVWTLLGCRTFSLVSFSLADWSWGLYSTSTKKIKNMPLLWVTIFVVYKLWLAGTLQSYLLKRNAHSKGWGADTTEIYWCIIRARRKCSGMVPGMWARKISVNLNLNLYMLTSFL